VARLLGRMTAGRRPKCLRPKMEETSAGLSIRGARGSSSQSIPIRSVSDRSNISDRRSTWSSAICQTLTQPIHTIVQDEINTKLYDAIYDDNPTSAARAFA
jgi:hypothetical protein